MNPLKINTTKITRGLTTPKWIVFSFAFMSLLINGAMAKESKYEKKYKTFLGQEIACIDECKGRPVVFLHGNTTCSFLWRDIIPYVSKQRTSPRRPAGWISKRPIELKSCFS